ncbi:MAG: FtsW/RodA/SpoVE family cell cycle protein, partial [Paraburkholderia graminis]
MSWSERFGSRTGAGAGDTANAARVGGRTGGSGLASAVNGVRPLRSRMLDYDHSLLWVVVALLGLGVVMVYSASIAMPDSPKYASYRDYAFLVRQIIFVTMGAVVGVIAFRIPISTWDKYAPKLFLIALVALVIVLIPHVGKGVNGARRWIPLGITNMQPSEIMKLAVTIYAANYTVRKQEYMHSFAKGFLPMAMAVGFVGALLLLEPDMGAFMVIAAIAMGLLFLGGVNGKLFGGLVATAVGTFSLLVWASPWRRERIFAYLDPW